MESTMALSAAAVVVSTPSATPYVQSFVARNVAEESISIGKHASGPSAVTVAQVAGHSCMPAPRTSFEVAPEMVFTEATFMRPEPRTVIVVFSSENGTAKSMVPFTWYV